MRLLAIQIGDRTHWYDGVNKGIEEFPTSKNSRMTQFQEFVKWLNMMNPDAVCFLDMKSRNAIYFKFIQHLMSWAAQNDIVVKGFPEDKVKQYTRAAANSESLYKFATEHKW